MGCSCITGRRTLQAGLGLVDARRCWPNRALDAAHWGRGQHRHAHAPVRLTFRPLLIHLPVHSTNPILCAREPQMATAHRGTPSLRRSVRSIAGLRVSDPHYPLPSTARRGACAASSHGSCLLQRPCRMPVRSTASACGMMFPAVDGPAPVRSTAGCWRTVVAAQTLPPSTAQRLCGRPRGVGEPSLLHRRCRRRPSARAVDGGVGENRGCCTDTAVDGLRPTAGRGRCVVAVGHGGGCGTICECVFSRCGMKNKRGKCRRRKT